MLVILFLKPSHRAYDVIDKSNNDEIVAKKLSYDRALEKAHTNPNYKIKATQRLAENNQKYYDLLNDLRDEGHLHRYGVTQLQMQFGLSEEEAQEIYNQYKEDLKAEQPDAYDFYMKDLNEEENYQNLPTPDKINLSYTDPGFRCYGMYL